MLKITCISALAAAAVMGGFQASALPTPEQQAELARLHELIAAGDAEALAELAVCYGEGKMGLEKDPAKAFELASEASAKGSARADYILAVCYMDGVGVKQDIPAGAHRARLAAERGYAAAQSMLGMLLINKTLLRPNGEAEGVEWLERAVQNSECSPSLRAQTLALLGSVYYNGQVTGARDLEKALPYLRAAADAGDVDAQFFLGERLLTGNEMEKDPATGERYLTAAAEQGSAGAQNDLGVICMNREDYTQAVHWLKLAAEQNHPGACNNLGVLYMKGLGLEKDATLAAHYMRLAAEQGDAAAQDNLGQMALENIGGVDGGPEEAEHWFTMAAQQGYAPAMNRLGLIYLQGLPPVPSKTGEAIYWLNAAAERGHADAAFNLFLVYDTGRSELPKNPEAARRYLTLAADNGHAQAQYQLGRLLQNAEGVEYLRQAARQGHADAMSSLGVAYANGAMGLPCDHDEAKKYFLAGAELGSGTSLYSLGVMCLNGDRMVQDSKRGIELLTQAAELSNEAALDALARIYALGLFGLEPDHKKAVAYAERAAAMNNTEAMMNLARILLRDGSEVYDKEAAMRWLHKAVDLGSEAACNLLGALYMQDGHADEAERVYTQGLSQGHVECRKSLVQLYCQTGHPEKALELLQQAVTQEQSPDNLRLLAVFYASAQTPYYSLPKAVSLLTPLAESNDGEACAMLSAIWLKGGEGVPKDEERGLAMLRKAADLGVAAAQLKMASLAFDATPRRTEEALHYLNLMAPQDDEEMTMMANLMLGYIYAGLDADTSAFEDKEKADALLKPIADKQNESGMMVYSHFLIKHNRRDDAVRYLKEAAKSNNTAKYVLATMYLEDLNDTDAAVELYTECAQSGYLPAREQLGRIYCSRVYERQNKRLALAWLEPCVRTDSPNALFLTAAIYLEGGDGLEPNPQHAVALLRKLSESDKNSDTPNDSVLAADFFLAMAELRGLGTPEDSASALQRITKHSEHSLAFGYVLHRLAAHGMVPGADAEQARELCRLYEAENADSKLPALLEAYFAATSEEELCHILIQLINFK